MLIFFACLVGLLGAVLFYASTKPNECNFSRSIHILAPPEKIFPMIDDPRAMNEWNPFVKADPPTCDGGRRPTYAQERLSRASCRAAVRRRAPSVSSSKSEPLASA